MASTVTIGKSYFEALLRRAEFHTNETSDPTVTNNFISLTHAEHSYLRAQAREYAILRNALLQGGLTPETLDLLITGADSEQNDEEPGFQSHHQYNRQPAVDATLTKSGAADLTLDPSDRTCNNPYLSQPHNYGRSYSFGAADSGVTFAGKDEEPTGSASRLAFLHNEQRTILFTNLSDKTTHKDITDLIEVRWNDRQFRLLSHVANKIAGGATRNIVIRNGASKNLSERGIRDDMEHIHNLIVISVHFVRQDIYISTNSVHNSLFARTCMMSRALYKGLKIEWYPDECAAPIKDSLPAPTIVPQRMSRASSASLPPNKRQSKVSSSNLYSLLDMDGSEEDDSSDADNTTTSQAGFPSNGVRINWTDAAVIV
ncbi:hypothetical protein E2P81_ATG04126 [Venturia nashicola]|nr:hypothetical protein E2P81_ATG04126 [Venturia nashicola]